MRKVPLKSVLWKDAKPFLNWTGKSIGINHGFTLTWMGDVISVEKEGMDTNLVPLSDVSLMIPLLEPPVLVSESGTEVDIMAADQDLEVHGQVRVIEDDKKPEVPAEHLFK